MTFLPADLDQLSSDPASSNFAKHWTPEQVIEAFKPSHSAVQEVQAWLVDSGIASERITHSDNQAWLRSTRRQKRWKTTEHWILWVWRYRNWRYTSRVWSIPCPEAYPASYWLHSTPVSNFSHLPNLPEPGTTSWWSVGNKPLGQLDMLSPLRPNALSPVIQMIWYMRCRYNSSLCGRSLPGSQRHKHTPTTHWVYLNQNFNSITRKI